MTRWPKVPRRVEGLGGSITVKLVRRISVGGELCWGSWDDSTRTICLDSGAHRRHQWTTLFHELTHSGLDDAGLSEQLSDPGNEAICRAMASLHIRLMEDRLSA